MSRTRVTAPALGATLLLLLLPLLLVPSLALSAGSPPLSPTLRAALSHAADGQAFLPWQRQVMRQLALRPSASPSAVATTGVDGNWSELPPPIVQETPGVYDPVRHSMFIFGGSNQGNSTNDLWEVSLSEAPTWTLVVTAGPTPAARGGHVLIYDSRRERLLLFGGADAIVRNDSWALDLTKTPPEWGQGLPSGPLPARRAYASAVYDSLNDRAVLFGGADSVEANQGPASLVSDVWVLPFSGGPFAWTQLSPSGTPPTPRAGSPVIYDRARQRMVLFGGYDGSALTDAFTLSLGPSPAWAPLGASGGPPPGRAIPGTIYDAPHDRMLMFGGLGASGSLNDVWSLALDTNAWTQLTPSGGPPSARQFPAAAYDIPGNRMVICGGNADEGSVADPLWSLSLGASVAWTDLGGRRPPRRWDAANAFDPSRGIMWVHGGQGWDFSSTVVRQDLWALPLRAATGWSQPATTGTPLGLRMGHSAVYDALRDRLVFFGGNDGTTDHNDVWALTLSGTPAWSTLSPSGTPPSARLYASAVYDAVHDRMVVFGGSNLSGTQNDVWALSFAGSPAWSQINPSGTPPPTLWGQSAALDLDANRLIVFGGQSFGMHNAVYALTLEGSPTWTELSPSGTPPGPRQSASMVSLGTRMLVFAGDTLGTGNGGACDTWLLSLYPTPSWRTLDVGSKLPSGRWGNCAAFDPTTFRLTVYGGTGMTTEGVDTWALQMDEAVPTLASLVSANSVAGRVELSWMVSAAPWATVYRTSGHGSWTSLGRVTPDGTGRIGYVDRDVTAGSRYGYRLGLSAPGGEVFAGEVWVDVPDATARFALRGMMPNPAPAGAGLISFSLPDGSPARIEVVDVSGRQVFSREVGSLGRGEHLVQVSGSQPLAPGLYLVRLTQGGRSLTAKAVTIR